MKEQRLQKKAMKRGYDAVYRKDPLSLYQIEKVLKGIGRTLRYVFSKENAYLLTNGLIPDNIISEENAYLSANENTLQLIRLEIEYCSDRWNILRYRRLTFFIKKLKHKEAATRLNGMNG